MTKPQETGPRGHAVVTGGGSGIGFAIAGALAQDGWLVTIMGRSAARLQAALGQLPAGRVHAGACDVTDADAVDAAFQAAAQQHGPVALLVNNAGGVATAPFAKLSLQDWRAAMDLNFFGTLNCIRAVLPGMTQAGWGRIVNVGSTAGLKGYGYVSAYVAAKHAVVGLTRALALEVAKSGVTVNALCPGYADTEIIAEAVATIQAKTGRSAEEALATFTRTNPQGRLVKPQEVAGAVLWLASEAAAAVNGVALPIAGGEIG